MWYRFENLVNINAGHVIKNMKHFHIPDNEFGGFSLDLSTRNRENCAGNSSECSFRNR